MKAALVGAACAVLLAACASTSGHGHRYYTLLPSPSAAPEAERPATRDAVLLIAPIAVASFYDGKGLAFSDVEETRGYYQFSSWTEPPAQSVSAAITARLGSARLFRSVAPAGPGVTGRWLLRVRLDEIYHDARHAPGIARMAMTAELIDVSQRAVVGRRTFVASADAPSHDAAGAVTGMRAALATAVGELVAWVDLVVPA